MKKIQLMELITKITFLHIGQQWKQQTGMCYFVVLNSNPNEQKPVWQGVACWIAQMPLLMGSILGPLAFVSTLVEGYSFQWIVFSAAIAMLSTFGLYKLDGLFQKRPSWDKEDYVPTDEEWEDWDHWVHCEEEYQSWGF